jgi:hypothetical protein
MECEHRIGLEFPIQIRDLIFPTYVFPDLKNPSRAISSYLNIPEIPFINM